MASPTAGTFYGYSAACIAHALRAVGGRLTTVDSSAKSIAAAKRAFEAAALDNIDVVHARGVDFLTRLVDAKTPATAERQFDFIYIDADKGSYAAYVDLILDHALLSARGLLVVDNVLWKGEVVAAEHLSTAQVSKQARALVAFNAKVSRDPRIRCTLLPMRDGLYLIQWQDTAL